MPSGTIDGTGVKANAGWGAVALGYSPWQAGAHALRFALLGGVEVASVHVASGDSVTRVDPG